MMNPQTKPTALVQPAGPEGGEVVALVLGGVEEVDEEPLEQERGARTTTVPHA